MKRFTKPLVVFGALALIVGYLLLSGGGTSIIPPVGTYLYPSAEAAFASDPQNPESGAVSQVLPTDEGRMLITPAEGYNGVWKITMLSSERRADEVYFIKVASAVVVKPGGEEAAGAGAQEGRTTIAKVQEKAGSFYESTPLVLFALIGLAYYLAYRATYSVVIEYTASIEIPWVVSDAPTQYVVGRQVRTVPVKRMAGTLYLIERAGADDQALLAQIGEADAIRQYRLAFEAWVSGLLIRKTTTIFNFEIEVKRFLLDPVESGFREPDVGLTLHPINRPLAESFVPGKMIRELRELESQGEAMGRQAAGFARGAGIKDPVSGSREFARVEMAKGGLARFILNVPGALGDVVSAALNRPQGGESESREQGGEE